MSVKKPKDLSQNFIFSECHPQEVEKVEQFIIHEIIETFLEVLPLITQGYVSGQWRGHKVME